MAISYTKDQRQFAKDNGLKLASVELRSVKGGGMAFQGPVTEKQAEQIYELLLKIVSKK